MRRRRRPLWRTACDRSASAIAPTPAMIAPAALVLFFDIAAGAAAEHDDWHTHEHMPERLGISGFRRGTRWVAGDAADAFVHYCIVYEVASLAVLDSAAYRARLDRPTPWTSAMMRHYRGMRRTLCTLQAGSGCGSGSSLAAITFAPAADSGDRIDRWLSEDVLPGLAQRPGLADVRLFRNALAATMTTEQAIRGRDATVDAALLVTGYDHDAVAALARGELAPEQFAARGAAAQETAVRVYRQAYTLVADEIAPPP